MAKETKGKTISLKTSHRRLPEPPDKDAKHGTCVPLKRSRPKSKPKKSKS